VAAELSRPVPRHGADLEPLHSRCTLLKPLSKPPSEGEQRKVEQRYRRQELVELICAFERVAAPLLVAVEGVATCSRRPGRGDVEN